MGHRPDGGSADAVREDRRHRRPRTLSGARSPEGQLQRLGPRVWARGFAEDPDHSGQEPRSESGAGQLAGRGGAVLPGGELAVPDGDSGQERVPGHRRGRQRHLAEREDAGRLDPQREVGRLHRVPRARHERHERDTDGPRSVSDERRRVGPAREIGTGGRPDERRAQRPWPQPCAEDVRRLDRSGSRGRASAGAAAAAGHRAQRRDHAVGLGRSEGVPARRGLDRSEKSARQRERAGLRRARAERRLHAGAESGDEHREPDTADGPRSEHPADEPVDAGALALLGRRADLDQQEQRAQSDARSQGPGLAGVDGPAGGQSRRLQGRFEPPLGQTLPGRQRGPPPRGVRPRHEEAHAHRHVFRHASPDVRRGREPHAVDERGRTGHRLAEHEDVRRDAGRDEVAGLDGAHQGRQRKRQARRVHRAESAARSQARISESAARSTPSRRRPTAPSGARSSATRAPSSGSRPARILRKRPSPRSISLRPRRAIRRAAATSIATACTGRPWPAVTSPASTAASARVR